MTADLVRERINHRQDSEATPGMSRKWKMPTGMTHPSSARLNGKLTNIIEKDMEIDEEKGNELMNLLERTIEETES